MSALTGGAQGSKKRKKDANGTIDTTSLPSKRLAVEQDATAAATIQKLEDQIVESRKFYNNIATLLSMLNAGTSKNELNLTVAVALCRIFCRLIAGGDLKEQSRATEQEKIIVAWLKERCQEYQRALLDVIRQAEASFKVTALHLSMRLANARAAHLPGSETHVWLTGLFKGVFEALIEAREGESLQSEFVEQYLREYEDIRYYTFMQITVYAAEPRNPEILERLIFIISQCDVVPQPEHEFTKSYVKLEKKDRNPLLSVGAHKKRAQEAWLAILKNGLSDPQRKQLLRMMSHTIVPWFNRPELLMDFLTDSYNSGGSTSLLALSGLFYLIQEKNLDYPQFYPKLYSLLDADLLHSKHRSRFFRLMETFLASTHLPATLVASFIKRLSKLALHAPPTAIVAIVPFIYNLLKSHPTCTFMIHRAIHDKDWIAELEVEGMDDPFDPNEQDPTLTNAIESSLWEIETLQSHYHPNVAAIARIISEQFTKQAYNLEDFLDYTYQGMLIAELGVEERPFKKAPVIEFQIPKRIFTDRLLEEDRGEDTAPASMLRQLWDFST